MEGRGYPIMMSPDENTPIRGAGKNGKAGPRAKKAAKRSRKSAQQETAQQETAKQETAQQETAQQAAPEPVTVEQPQQPVTVAMEDPFTDTAPDVPPVTAPDIAAPTAPAEPTEAAPVSLQTITNAYGDFTRKSIEQTGSFFEQLAGVRSLDRAFELQVEFAQQTYETFVSELRKIRELHSELTMQRLRNLEGLVARKKPTRSN